jgi:hypothetical protein
MVWRLSVLGLKDPYVALPNLFCIFYFGLEKGIKCYP